MQHVEVGDAATRPARWEDYVSRTAPLRLALKREEAAESLSMSLDSFERHVQPHVRMVRRGKLRLVPVSELQRWLDSNATLALER
jgi:hypothetical protein